MRVIVVVLILAVGIAAAVVFLRSRRTVVLGAQLAEASERDRLHRKRFSHLKSPLPPLRYDLSKEFTLIDPQVSDLDLQLRSLCSRVVSSSPDERRALQNGATGDDFYTLLNFARRASVFALRDRDEKRIQEALTAVAMIDATRIDERDVPFTLSLVHHAAERLRLRPLELFDTAAELAQPPTSEIMRSFVRQSATYKNIQSSWGYQEIQGSGGAGFVRRSFVSYEPTRDLLGAALAMREAFKRDHYEGDVMLATKLPSIWFPKAARAKAEGVLAHSVAAASVDSFLHTREYEGDQSLLVFVVETRSEQDAATLQALAESSPTEGTVTIGVHNGRLFALAIGESFGKGVPSYETKKSIQRFEGPIRAALQKAGE